VAFLTVDLGIPVKALNQGSVLHLQAKGSAKEDVSHNQMNQSLSTGVAKRCE